MTTGVGRTGIVGVLKNGTGPSVHAAHGARCAAGDGKHRARRYASTIRTKDDAGTDVGVMHACGHDMHMAAWMGTARIMAGSRGSWRGTLVVIGQPAEETGRGRERCWRTDS